MWILIDDVKRGCGYIKAFPHTQPDGEYGVDHLRLWIAPAIRSRHSDDVICEVLESALFAYGQGSEQPMTFGCIAVSVNYGSGSDHTISLDHVGDCFTHRLRAPFDWLQG